MTESMTEDRGLNRLIPAPNLNLMPLACILMAETGGLKICPSPSSDLRSPLAGFSSKPLTAKRLPLTAFLGRVSAACWPSCIEGRDLITIAPHPWFALRRTADSSRAGSTSATQVRAVDGSESRPYQPTRRSARPGDGAGEWHRSRNLLLTLFAQFRSN